MMTWPNRITVLRILLLTPFLILLLNAPEYPNLRYWALGVFAVMAVCDALDGHIARRYNQRTRLGTILDPLADKLVLTVTIIILTFPDWLGPLTNTYHIPIWVTVTILSKDAVILLGVVILHFVTSKTLIIQPSIPGKVATALAFILVLVTLLAPDLSRLAFPRLLAYGQPALGALAAAVSAIAVVDYIRRGSKLMAAHSGASRVSDCRWACAAAPSATGRP
jgi:CDP-diacylglycerol--glycerol-3-phosphate 3-phosphatidyltransferase